MTLADYEADLEQTKDETAKLMGHANHNQKIRYHLKMKEENVALKQELRVQTSRILLPFFRQTVI